jgi:hypothetical protein
VQLDCSLAALQADLLFTPVNTCFVYSLEALQANFEDPCLGPPTASEEGVNDADFDDSVMMAYCHTLQQQMQLEYGNNPEKKEVHLFLVKELGQRTTSCLPHHQAHFYCQRLNLKFLEIGYYHDLNMWLPHEQWGIVFMPCPKYHSPQT